MKRENNSVAKRRGRDGSPAHSAATRQKLVDSAGPIFAEKGYYSATVREICKQAGANVAAVNYHFKDKLGLYEEVLMHCKRAAHVDQMRAALEQTGSPEDILRDVIRARVQGLRKNAMPSWQLRIFAHELADPTPALSRMINRVSRPIFERLLELIAKIIGLPAHDAKTRLCAHSVMGQILFYVFAGPVLERFSPDMKMTDEMLEQIANHIADFSLAYLREVSRNAKKTRTSAIEAKHG
jgi:TetR/AcrR family transcriptional regulator, regulator of cefoperazone and chloramphenicol sensitivity